MCKQIKLKERLPQVGSKIYNYLIDDNRFILDQNIYNRKIDFIIDNDLNLKFGKGHYKLNNKQDFLTMAGELIINADGKIAYISNNSGHYQPTEDEFNCFINSFFIPETMFEQNYIVQIRNFETF